MSADVTVRFYAAAAEAAGAKQIAVALETEPTPLHVFLDSLPQAVSPPKGGAGPTLSGVCGYSSFLINAVQAKPDKAVLSRGDTLDILPPFAGG